MDTTTANKEVALIDQAKDLRHLNELVTDIENLKAGYVDLKIEGPEDKAGYELVRAAIGVLRPKRTGLEAERKSVVKPYNDTVKFINGEYEKITSLIQEGPGGELELKQKKEAVDDILKQQEEEEKRQAELKINNRINELIAAGMVFDGSWYVIGDNDLGIPFTTVGIVDVRTMSDLQYQNTLELVTDKSKKITAEKERVAELERKEKAEQEEKEKKEREEFEEKKRKLDEQEKQMEQQRQQMQEQQDKIDRQNREAEQREQQAQQEKIKSIIRARSAVLTGMGLEYNPQGGPQGSFDYSGEALVADASSISDHDDTAWLSLIETLKATIAQKKADAEAFLKKQKDDEAERLRLQEQERQAGMNDQQKIKEYFDALLAIPAPEFKTKKWKTIAAYVRDTITDNRPA